MQKKSSPSTVTPDLLSYQLGLVPFSAMTSVLPLASPRFPTMADLLKEQAPPAPSEDGSDLFRSLLRDDPHELYQDSLNNPSKYDPVQASLLADLVSSTRSPTSSERQVLNTCVNAWLEETRLPTSTPKSKPGSTAVGPSRQYRQGSSSEGEEAPSVPKAFSWL